MIFPILKICSVLNHIKLQLSCPSLHFILLIRMMSALRGVMPWTLSYVRSMFEEELGRSVAWSLGRPTLSRSLDHSLSPSIAGSMSRSLDRSHAWSLETAVGDPCTNAVRSIVHIDVSSTISHLPCSPPFWNKSNEF